VAESESKTSIVAEPPLSIAQASLDDKGRLKLTSEYLGYLDTCGIKSVFITTLDLRVARIYPIQVWQRNQILFENAGENAAQAERLAFIARVYGGNAEIDASGRVLLPAKLREALGLERQPVWLELHNGRINVMSKKVYDERMQLAMATLADDLKSLEKMGLR
jgi:DNA-binding transcriptional regulator/RsmH inhibitor MraZ